MIVKPINNNTALCIYLLMGARGDLQQNRYGHFVYYPSDWAPGTHQSLDCQAPLILLTHKSMTLTPSGAQFMLDNLASGNSDFSPREITILKNFAGEAVY